MDGPAYLLIWIVLLAFPAAAAWKRKWWAFGIYALGCLFFLITTLRDEDGWGDLAAIATLLVVVGPIYLVGTLVSVISFFRRKPK
ncbi:hypothetical protein SD71_12210 [Cohnella kolymensis]|uniref:Uncharacterized protein n=1 Tax=Cohnella kolymensis TaxID=1590652 RepID=A0ABR5A3M9_9BACL|nr:hypothetical protein [Cohnella kolymensis]KIL35657.1 hypothetical protein SD71_12210 [Cohnella kolymensis]